MDDLGGIPYSWKHLCFFVVSFLGGDPFVFGIVLDVGSWDGRHLFVFFQLYILVLNFTCIMLYMDGI